MHFDDDKDMTKRQGRARYRANHRGTREMDFLLGRYGEACVPDMDGAQLELFEELLALPDPVLAAALIDGVGEFSAPLEALLEQIRQFHKKSQGGAVS